jgi:2-haloacid dehalogenase
MEITDFDTLTFDCYGTLIDWETGIWEALQPWLRRTGHEVDRETALEAYARHESRQQAQTPEMLYPELVSRVQQALAEEWDVPSNRGDAAAFGAAVGEWPAFADSAASLAYLKQHYRLVVLSNVDRASFARSNLRLGVQFDAVYTAEEIGSYKPDPANFRHLLEHLGRLGIARERILHTAQSLFHDHAPARDADLATCWIDRREGREGWGATRPPPGEVRPDFRFPSMAALVERHRELHGKG